jgi:F-type H+/Na+-transporting ATPase subunit alpha
VRESLKQIQYDAIPVVEQIAVLLAVNAGLLDAMAVEQASPAEQAIRKAMRGAPRELHARILSGAPFGKREREEVLSVAEEAIRSITGKDVDGNP